MKLSLLDRPVFFKKHILDSKPYVGGSTRTASGSGKQMIKMSSNENPLGPSPKALEAIRGVMCDLHEYQHQDDQLLIEKLSVHFEDVLKPEQFLPANSGMELLDLICRGFLEKGNNCILSSPTFMAYRNFAELAGARVIDVPLQKESFALDVKSILEAIDENTRIVFVSNPNNPTGSLFPERDIRALVNGLPDHVILVYDEVYFHFVERKQYFGASTMIGEGENVIGLHSFSKAYGLSGIRVGYLFSTPEIAGYLRHFRRPFMISSLGVAAAVAALDDHDHLARTVRMTGLEKKWLYHKLEHYGITYWPSDANFILIRPPVEAERFCKYLLSEGIMVRETSPLGAPGLVRITIGNREMNGALIQAIYKLKHAKFL